MQQLPDPVLFAHGIDVRHFIFGQHGKVQMNLQQVKREKNNRLATPSMNHQDLSFLFISHSFLSSRKYFVSSSVPFLGGWNAVISIGRNAN